jgi:hypothetical protein
MTIERNPGQEPPWFQIVGILENPALFGIHTKAPWCAGLLRCCIVCGSVGGVREQRPLDLLEGHVEGRLQCAQVAQ